jgi:hypothetical protein
MANTFETIGAILLLAAVVEALTEYLVRPLVLRAYRSLGALAPDDEQPSLPALRYVSAAFGVALCVLYRADLLALLGLDARFAWVGYVVTGLLIGRGANFVSDFAGRWLRPAPEPHRGPPTS